MAGKPVIQKGVVPPKGYWQTPWQIYQTQKDSWDKFYKIKEDIDLEEFEKTKPISYFNGEPEAVITSDYDRRFHPGDDNPKAKLQIIRDNIFKEEEERIMPVVVSHIYGHRHTNLEGKTWRSFRRVNTISDIYSRYHLNLKPDKKLPKQE